MTTPLPQEAPVYPTLDKPGSLSVFLIVKNEAKHLPRLLPVINEFADELIVVDTGSEDDTVAIAEANGALVKHFVWCDDFAAARNVGMTACTKDWIMWLDADDVITPKMVKGIQEFKGRVLIRRDLRTIFCHYHYEYSPDGNVAVDLNRERFLKNGIGHHWIGRIHEVIAAPWEYSLRVENLVVEHRTDPSLNDRKKGRNLRIFEQYIDIEKDSLRELFLYGSELHQVGRFEDAIRVLKKYQERAARDGIIDGVGESYAVCIKLADAFLSWRKPQECLDHALSAIRLNPLRAEGYALTAAVYFFGGMPQAALPLLIAAMQCPVPPPTTSLVITKLFAEVPIQMFRDACAFLGTNDPIRRYTEIGKVMRKMDYEFAGYCKKNAAQIEEYRKAHGAQQGQ